MTQKTPEKIFALATQDADFSAGELRLLNSGLALLRHPQEKKLNAIEMKALLGVIAYVSYTQNVGGETVMAVLSAHFGVAAINHLPSRLYDAAVDFLLHVKMDHVVN